MNVVITLLAMAVFVEGTYAVSMKVKNHLYGMKNIYDSALIIAGEQDSKKRNDAIKVLGVRIAGL